MSKQQGEALCRQVLTEVSNEVANNWRKIAGSTLKGMRSTYISGIVVVEEGRLKNAVVLRGSMNNMIESGSAPYDMKPIFSGSSKVKFNKSGGWYLRIPFRHATPGSIGENQAFSSVMPREIYDAVKNLKAQKTTMAGTRLQKAQGLSKDQIPKAFRDVITKKNREGFGDYTHKSPIHEGVFRTEKIKSDGSRESTYMSIRTVGSASDPNSWIHPGFKAANLAEKAQQATDYDTLVNNIVDKFLSSL